MRSSILTAGAVRLGVCVAAASGLLATSACSSAAGGPAARASAAGAASASQAASPSPSSSDAMSMPDMGSGQETGAAAGIRLASLLAQHSVLVADMMRARITRAPDVAQAADAALGRNTQALGSLVDSLFGAKAGAQFTQLWGDHIRYFYAYADALGNTDTTALDSARNGLATSEKALGSFFSGASAGRLTQAAAQQAVTAHIQHLLAQADAFKKADYSAAADDYSMAYEHGFAMGDALAAALLPKADVAQLALPQWKLRAAVTNLLGEHVALVVAAMRAATGPPAGFTAMGTQLNRNTVALASAVDSLYGAGAAHRFQNLWSDHVDALMLYTSSTVRGDTAGTGQAEAKLRSFEPVFASFLAGAVQSRLGADALAHAFLEHDRMLVGEISAYQGKDYNTAHQLSYQAYQQMYDLSGQLAHAVGVTLSARQPRGGTQTGGGGMASVVGRR